MKKFWQSVWFNLTHITFKGRTSRKEYLYWFLFHIAFSFAILLLISLPAKILAPHSQELSTTAMLMAMIYFLGVSLVVLVISIWKFVADVTVIVRRFHDFGTSAWIAFPVYWCVAMVVAFIAGIGFPILYSMVAQLDKQAFKLLGTSTVNIVILFFSIVLVAICIFKKGDEGENKYGLPSELQ